MTASKVVLLDSLITNIDRTHKNTNLLSWYKELWLIDHGASLFFHHAWTHWQDHAKRMFPAIKDHVLLEKATELRAAAEDIKSRLNQEVFQGILSVVPDDFLTEEGEELDPDEKRTVYLEFLNTRLSMIDTLTKEAEDARKGSI